MGYSKQAFIGISWAAGLRFVTRGISFFKTIILARILIPTQFGVYGVATLALALLEVFTETGVNVILVQEKGDIKEYINSAWIVSIIRGIIIALVILLSASWVSSFFHSKDSLIMLQVISIAPFLRGFINPAIVRFQKELEFHKEFWYRSLIFLVDAGTSVAIALHTHQASSLALGMIAGVIFEIILSFWLIKPRPRFKLESEYIKTIIHRGKWVTASSIFNYLFHNADNIIVGRILGTTSLGLYQMAYTLSIIPITEISDVISKVAFPVYSRISGNNERLRSAFIKTLIAIAFLSVPFGLLLFFFPKMIVKLILGDKWMLIIPILPILAIFGVIRGISGFTATLFLAVKKQLYVSIITLVSLIGLLLPIVPLVLGFGIVGAALAALIGTVIALPFIIYFTAKIFANKE